MKILKKLHGDGVDDSKVEVYYFENNMLAKNFEGIFEGITVTLFP